MPPPLPDHCPSSPSSDAPSDDHSLLLSRPAPSPPSRLVVALTVAFYLLAALVMVFVNKWVLNAIPAPVFFLFSQLLIAVFLLKSSSLLGLFQPPTWSPSILTALLPLIAINVLGLVLNTYCLQFVDASFYQVARGLVLPFTVLASYFMLGTKSSKKIILSISIVCLGFIVGVSSERLSVSFLGVLLGVLSSMTTSVHAIVVKRVLNKMSSSTMDLAYLTNLLSSLAIIPLIVILGEIPIILALFSGSSLPQTSTNGTDAAKSYDLQTFLVGTLVTGVFGFLISLAGFLSIKVTSPVTHMISSAVRGVIQTGLGALIFHDIITWGRLAGIIIILAGSVYYTFVKDQELYQRPSPSRSSPSLIHRSAQKSPQVGSSDQKHVVIQLHPPRSSSQPPLSTS